MVHLYQNKMFAFIDLSSFLFQYEMSRRHESLQNRILKEKIHSVQDGKNLVKEPKSVRRFRMTTSENHIKLSWTESNMRCFIKFFSSFITLTTAILPQMSNEQIWHESQKKVCESLGQAARSSITEVSKLAISIEEIQARNSLCYSERINIFFDFLSFENTHFISALFKL